MKEKRQQVNTNTVEVVNYITPINKDLKTIITSETFKKGIIQAVQEMFVNCGYDDIDSDNYQEVVDRLWSVNWAYVVLPVLIKELYEDEKE